MVPPMKINRQTNQKPLPLPSQDRAPESNTWKVIPHSQVPFVLLKDNQIVETVFRFLQLLHARGMSAKTIRAYAYDLLAFHRFLSDEAVPREAFDASHVVSFILSQRKLNAAPRTINRRLTVVRSYLNHLESNLGDRAFRQTGSPPGFYRGAKNKSLLGPLRIKEKTKTRSLTVKVPAVLITPLTPAEIKKFLLGFRKYRDLAILHLMLFCGLRSCEVLSVDVNDIDLIDDFIRIRGKGGKERILPLSPAVRSALMNYLDYERPDGKAVPGGGCPHSRCFVVLKGRRRGQPLTPEGLRKLFRNQRNKSVKKAHPHLFRHTFATHLIREKVSLPVVQKLMGHSDIEMTMGYVHLSLDDVSAEYHQAIRTLQQSCQTTNNHNE